MEKYSILLIDDDIQTLQWIRHALVNNGYQITTAENGETALKILRERGKEFDLVITNRGMEPVDGLKVLRTAKQMNPETMVMVLAGRDEGDLATVALEHGADAYLYKPPDLGQLLFKVSSCMDKLRLRRKGLALQTELHLFKNLVASQNEAIAVSDPDGRMLYVNPAHEKLFGRSLESARLRDCRDYYSEQSVKKHNDEILPVLQSRKFWEGIVEVFDAEKRRIPLWQWACGKYDEEGKIQYIFTLMHVIKQRKEEKKLYKVQQTQALGTLAGGIAHEFNNILWIIMANAEMIADGLPEGNTAHKNLQRVEKACTRGKDLVQQILSFSRQGEHTPRPLNIMPIVKESLKFLRTSIPTTIDIQQNFTAESATILSDPSQLHQTLIHLCTNAADAIGKKPGILEISVTDVEFGKDETALHVDLNAGKYVRLSVKDTGIGMEPAVRERIFEPFFTTKGVGEGRGMGLAVVHGIVKSCEGAIVVHSEPGKGSTFHVYFPKIQEGGKPEVSSSISFVKGRGRILFVDDDKDIAIIGKDMLERLGYQVTSETLPENALETFRSSPDKFDLIITDMIMPRMTGIKLAEQLMGIRSNIPVILCTGYHEDTCNESAGAIGIKEVIMKPVSRDRLVRAVRKALQEDRAI